MNAINVHLQDWTIHGKYSIVQYRQASNSHTVISTFVAKIHTNKITADTACNLHQQLPYDNIFITPEL